MTNLCVTASVRCAVPDTCVPVIGQILYGSQRRHFNINFVLILVKKIVFKKRRAVAQLQEFCLITAILQT